MDIGVYSFPVITEAEIARFLDERKTFVLEDVSRIHMSEVVSFLEKAMEDRSLKCRAYTKGRFFAMGAAMAIPVVGWLTVAGITAHTIATWSPDYEIAKNPATGTLTVTYQKKK